MSDSSPSPLTMLDTQFCGPVHAELEVLEAAPKPPTTTQGGIRARTKQNTTRRRRTQAKKKRFTEFTNFLLSHTGGASNLNRGGVGVLDVAGGKGQLGMELCVRAGVGVTVIDPVMSPLSVRGSELLLAHCSRIFQERHQGEDGNGQDDSPTTTDTNQNLHAWIHPKVASSPSNTLALTHLQAIQHLIPLHTHQTLFSTSFLLTNPLLFSRATVILGLHPDQATEPIIRHCLAAQKPFAVVPCCVFPNANPDRRIRGKQVRSLEEFLEWLCGLAPEGVIEREILEGVPGPCNVVLYYNLQSVGVVVDGERDGGEGVVEPTAAQEAI